MSRYDVSTEGAIFHPLKVRDGEAVLKTTSFGRGGQVPSDSPEVCAKLVESGDSASHWVMQVVGGPNSGRIFDPWDPIEPKRGAYEIRRTNQNCFNLYLSYLNTGNELFMRNAQRELNA